MVILLANKHKVIIFKYDLDTKQFIELSFLDNEYKLRLDSKIPEDLVSTISFLLDYYKSNDIPIDEIERLTKHMFSKLRYFQNYLTNDINNLSIDNTEPITLRQIAYDNVKEVLETEHKANLDDLTKKILTLKYPIELKRDSVRSSVSAIFSALRNGFKDLGVEGWNKPIWRGKSTGRNPHIKVHNNFIMPSYILLWERYGDYLKKRKHKR